MTELFALTLYCLVAEARFLNQPKQTRPTNATMDRKRATEEKTNTGLTASVKGEQNVKLICKGIVYN
jgi:hypothetical protein